MAQQAFRKGKATRVFLALLLAFSLVGIGAVPAAADPADDTQAAVDAAQATLDEAESRMAQINSEYEQLTAEVAELQTKIDETAAAAMEAQQAMLEGRAALGQVAVGEYRDGSSMGLLGLILDSKNFDELLRNMEYVTQIMSYQADEVAEQKERKRAFDDVSDELNAQKNEQEEALAAQEAKRAEAQSVVEDATARLEGAQEEHAARLAEARPWAERPCKQSEEEAATAAGCAAVRGGPRPSRAIASRSSPTTRALPITAARRVALAIPAAQDHPEFRQFRRLRQLGLVGRLVGGRVAFRRGLGLRRQHRSEHAEPRHHVHRRRLRRQLHGRGGAQVDAELPQLFRTYGGNRLRRSDRVCHGERLRKYGRRFPRSRSAAGRVEGLRLLQLPRLGPAHRQVPLPVGRLAAPLERCASSRLAGARFPSVGRGKVLRSLARVRYLWRYRIGEDGPRHGRQRRKPAGLEEPDPLSASYSLPSSIPERERHGRGDQ